MTSSRWTLLFAAALVVSLAMRAWLATRQSRHVATHRDAVPAAFAATVPLAAHRKAADYTLAKIRFGQLQMVFGAVVLVGWTLLGGLGELDAWVRGHTLQRLGGLGDEISLVVAFAVIGGLLELPFDLYATFGLEARFGFNRTTWRLWLADAAKGLLLSVVVGIPLVVERVLQLLVDGCRIVGPTTLQDCHSGDIGEGPDQQQVVFAEADRIAAEQIESADDPLPDSQRGGVGGTEPLLEGDLRPHGPPAGVSGQVVAADRFTGANAVQARTFVALQLEDLQQPIRVGHGRRQPERASNVDEQDTAGLDPQQRCALLGQHM